MTEGRVGPYGHLTDSNVLKAVGLVRTGQVVRLDLPVDAPSLVPGAALARPELVHKARMHNEVRPRTDGTYVVVNDDVVEFALQGSSHWDALAHWGAIEDGDPAVFADGRTYSETFPAFGAKTLGIDALAEGVVTRGVLLDLVAHLEGPDARYLTDERHVTAGDINSCLEIQQVELRPGDAVLLFTGFQARHAELGFMRPVGDEQVGLAPGLALDALDVFREAGTFALIGDNPSVESNPMNDGRFHTVALKHAAIYLGELWALEELTRLCRTQQRWDFLLVSTPLYVRGAFGSPANAVAIL